VTFAFTDEQSALLETIEGVLQARCSGDYLRSTISDGEAWRKLWDELHALDVLGIAIPEDAGGLGLGAVELAGMAEAAGASAAPVPLVATAASFSSFLIGAEPATGRDALLEAIAGEGATGNAVVPLNASAWGRIEGGSLSLPRSIVADVGRVDWLAIPARDEAGLELLAVLRTADLPIEPTPSLDLTRPLGTLALDGHPIGDRLVLPGSFDMAFATAWTSHAAELVGLGSALVARAVAYAGERQQFGVPIGSFQAVKHHLVDAHIAVERARSLTYRAAAELAGEHAAAGCRQSAHLAKAAASEAATTAARTAVQVHGGIGITAEHDISLYYLRARQSSAALGAAEAHYEAAAASVSAV
jgi:alkylation response protein AidB-like acyl-CoA dehydrogenase